MVAGRRWPTRECRRRRSSPHLHPVRPQPNARKAKGGAPSGRWNFAATVVVAGARGLSRRSEVMTEDRDFKQIVRDRAAKTGESYQTARRILERKRGRFSALATTTFDRPAGRVLGCIMEDGKVTRGMKVTVTAPDGVTHQGVVVSLRHMWDDVDAVSCGEFGEFGLLLEPAYRGPIPAQVTA